MKLYLIEYYTKSGYIKFAWVKAEKKVEALFKLKNHKTAKFDEKITISEQDEISPLRLGMDKAVFIDCEE